MAKTGMKAGKRAKGPALAGKVAALAVPAKGQPAPARQAVVVLAMHRTGSSALSRILNLLGCDLPKTLMGGDASNETGHWESTVVRALNDDVLASGGSSWQDWHAFNPMWYNTARPAEFLSRATEVLAEEYGKTSLLVLKDPRICRIFPFWHEVLKAAGIAPRVLIPLRHPAEVAASLDRRNAIPQAQGLLMWLRHMLEAEYSSRGLPRAVVSYDRLLVRPVEVMRALQDPLGLIWPRLSENTAAEIDAFMSPDLRHHKADTDRMTGLAFSDWLERTYGILRRWSESGEDAADWPALDAVRAAMDSFAAPLREVVGVLARQATDLAALDKDVRYLRGEAGKRGDAVAALTAEKKALTQAAETEKSALLQQFEDEKAAQAEAHRGEIDRREKDLATLRDEAAEREETLAALTAELESLRRTMAEAQEAREAEREAHRAETAAGAEAVAALTAELETLRRAMAEAQEAREAEREEAERLGAEARTARDAALADLAQMQAAQEAMGRETRVLRDEMQGHAQAVAALSAKKTALTQALETERAALAQALEARRETARTAEAAEAERAALATRLAEATEENATLTRRLAEIAETARDNAARAEALQEDLDALQRQKLEASEAFDLKGQELRAELDALTARLSEAETARHQEAQRLAEEMADLIGQNMTQADRLAEAEAARQALADSLSETQSALRQRQHESEETAAALAAKEEELGKAEAELDRLQKAQAADRAALEAARRDAKAGEAARYDEIAELTRTLIARDKAIAAQASRIHAVNAAYAELNNVAEGLKRDLAAREAAAGALMAEIEQRGAAIGHLMHLTEEGRALAQRIGRAIDAILAQAERPWLRGKRQLSRKSALLRASGLFDADWYGQAHPDVAASGQDPAAHFILHGRAEGRHPLPDLARFLAGLPHADASSGDPES